MTFKTLLLGSAAAAVTFGGAQAADLGKMKAVPEPVNYVKACDALGAGYWYAPGTQTCIKVGGYAQFQVSMGDSDGSGVGSTTVPAGLDDHVFLGEAQIDVTANSSTEYGPLIGYVAFRAQSDGAGNRWSSARPAAPTWTGDKDVYVTDVYLSLGPLFAGHTGTIYGDYGGGYTVVNSGRRAGNYRADQVRLDWAFSGLKVQLGLEDYRDGYANYTSTNVIPATSPGAGNRPTGEFPDVVAALSGTFGILSAKVSGKYAARLVQDAWGISGTAEFNLDAIAKGDRFKVTAGYGENGGDMVEINEFNVGSYWNVMASAKHVWTPSVYSAATYSYNEGPTLATQEIGFSTTFTPVTNLAVTGEVTYFNPTAGSDYVLGYVRLKRSFP